MAKFDAGLCKTVGKGGVGESGATALLTHHVTAPIGKVMVLRTVDTSLCPNTGAAAMLLVNGQFRAADVITALGSAIQTDAQPGDRVTAVLHMFPLFALAN